MHVLILCNDFPPLNSIGAQRPHSWFRFFKNNGIDITVITKDWQQKSATPHDVVNQIAFDYTIEENTKNGTIFRVPNKSLLPEQMLVNYGDNFLPFLRKSLSLTYRLLSYLFPFFDKHYGIFEEATVLLQKKKVDFIIATGEPFILFKYGAILSKKFNIPWIADFRDGWFTNLVTSQQKGILISLIRKWELHFERSYIASSKFITTVDPLLASKLSVLHGKTTHVIYNGAEEFSPYGENHVSPDLPLILCHVGTLYPGYHAEVLLQAIHDLDSSGHITPLDLKVKFVGIEFFPLQHKRIMSFSTRVAQYLETSKRLSQEEVKRLNSEADFLVVFSEPSQPVIPAKTYEYIASRRPIMVIISDGSILTNLVTELKAGVVVDSLEELKKFLLEKIEAKRNHQSLFNYELNEQKASFYLRETQAAQFAALLR